MKRRKFIRIGTLSGISLQFPSIFGTTFNRKMYELPNLDKPEPKRNKVITCLHGIIDNST